MIRARGGRAAIQLLRGQCAILTIHLPLNSGPRVMLTISVVVGGLLRRHYLLSFQEVSLVIKVHVFCHQWGEITGGG